jgi:hypothetical protein
LFRPKLQYAATLLLNADLLERLKVFDTQIRSVLPLAAPLTVSDILHWPGIFGDESVDVETAVPACLTLAGEALDDFTASRAREGEKLAAVILLEKVGPHACPGACESGHAFRLHRRRSTRSSGSVCWTPCNWSTTSESVRKWPFSLRASTSPKNWRAVDPSR